MSLRFLRVFALLVVALGAFAGVARALDFDDEEPPTQLGEVGRVFEYEIGTHAGCLPHRLEIISGQLPPGLEIRRVDLDTHEVEGIPTQPGDYSVWIGLRDCDNKSAEALFSFSIGLRRWAITTDALKPAVMGSPYSMTLTGAGPDSNVTWEMTEGTLPAGLTLAPTGTITGTATAQGASTFTVKATANEKNFGPTRIDSRQYTLNVLAPLAARISRTTGELKTPFRATLLAAGGQGPYSWSATGVPAGLAVASDGTVSGVPRRVGPASFTARVTDATGATTDVTVRLVVRLRLAIATRALRPATAGRAYSAKLAARGGVEGRRWAIARGALPRGLALNATSGAISGVPRSAGTFRITVRVRDALGAVSTKALTLTVG
jgi:hypothetical protein